MKKGYEAWFRDVGRNGYAPPRIHLGSAAQNPVVLTPQDWRGPRANWAAAGLGHWEVHVARPGVYDVTLRCAPADAARPARLALRGEFLARELPAQAERCTFAGVRLTPGDGRLEAWLARGDETAGVLDVEVRRRD